MGDMIDRDEALKAVAENNVVTAIRMIRALPAAEPAEDALRGALRKLLGILDDGAYYEPEVVAARAALAQQPAGDVAQENPRNPPMQG